MKARPLLRKSSRFTLSVGLVLLASLVTVTGETYFSVRQLHSNSLLLTAVKHDNVAGVLSALQQGADANTRDSNDVSPSLWQHIKLFLTFKKQLSKPADEELPTALELAVETKEVSIVSALLKSGADPNVPCTNGDTLLILAQSRPDRVVPVTVSGQSFAPAPHEEAVIRQSISSIVRDLQQHGARVDGKSRAGDNWPLLRAVAREDVEIVRILLDGRANVNLKDDAGNTALMEAITFANEAIARMLLEKGADVNARDGYGDTPLITATLQDNDNLVRLLLEFKAEPGVRDKEGNTALILALQNKYTNIVRLLREHKNGYTRGVSL